MKHNQQLLLKNVLSSQNSEDIFNLKDILEILNSTPEVNVQMKMFSILSAHLMLNDANIEAIATFSSIYDKINKILTNCAPRRFTIVFNFLSALLYVDEEDSPRKKSLVMYAKNMIRSSGCLATMCDLFARCMMHQDAWRSLCRCIAETCRGIEANQSNCTHLIPMCVQRCSQQNMDIIMVLQSLLQSHPNNIKLFIDCNGLSLFRREFLQHDVSLELLATVAQSSSEAVALIVKTKICDHLRDFLHLYGSKSQIGQWATVILYYTSRVEATESQRNISHFDHKVYKANECLPVNKRANNQVCDLESTANTTKFFQNIMKEVIQCSEYKEHKTNDIKNIIATRMMSPSQRKSAENAAEKYISNPLIEISNRKLSNKTHTKNNTPYSDCIQPDRTFEMSFLENNFKTNNNNNKDMTLKIAASKINEIYKNPTQRNQRYLNRNSVHESLTEKSDIFLGVVDTTCFKPTFSSTPKKHRTNGTCLHVRRGPSNSRSRPTEITRELKLKTRRIKKRRPSKAFEQSTIIDKDIKHRSISGRLFDVINTSCISIVKTVKNIFKPKSGLHETKEEYLADKTSTRNESTCSYSFTNYMRKRDALLYNENTNKSNALLNFKPEKTIADTSMEMTNSCKTCNDTTSLKRKLLHDDNLKQTIRKLKLGINLYGCNFKKISRTFWPNEAYMSPGVLYNLYRKLIIK